MNPDVTNPCKMHWKFSDFKKTQNLKNKPYHKFRRCGYCTKTFTDDDEVYSAYGNLLGHMLLCEKCKNDLGLVYPERKYDEE